MRDFTDYYGLKRHIVLRTRVLIKTPAAVRTI